MKIRLDQQEGLHPGHAIEIAGGKPSAHVAVTIWNDDTHTSVQLSAERARQVAMALISAFGGGGDAG